ncbi:MAG: hypothetical protein AB7V36_01445 [Bacteroidales bacterium]|jgi:hypothetical protein|nr:hypothetical protein [Bacteroidales bacterium]NCU32303.1 hypothetical protein [Candidatus Moranbacteria bacterium]HPB02867.1 hypothetical protein [Bacteroidales bacterium]
MNKIILLIACFLLVTPAIAQNSVQADARLIEAFGNSKVQTLSNQYPDSIRYYNFFLDNAFEIWKNNVVAEYINPSETRSIILSKDNLAALNNLKAFNILTTGLQWDKNETLWVKIENADFYIKLHSLSYIENKFKAGK